MLVNKHIILQQYIHFTRKQDRDMRELSNVAGTDMQIPLWPEKQHNIGTLLSNKSGIFKRYLPAKIIVLLTILCSALVCWPVDLLTARL